MSVYVLALLRPCSALASGPQFTRRPAQQEELESYPLGAIVRCDAVLLPGRSRSLLLLVCQEPERTQPDVHFFQGLRLGVSAPGQGSTWGRAGTLWAELEHSPCRDRAGPLGTGRGLGRGGVRASKGAWSGKTFWKGGGFEDRLEDPVEVEREGGMETEAKGPDGTRQHRGERVWEQLELEAGMG